MQAEGLVLGRQGAPAHVRDPIRRQSFLRFPAPKDLPPGKATSTTEPASEDTAARLRIKVGDPVIRTDYQFPGTGQTTHVLTSWKPMAVVGKSTVALPEPEPGPHAGNGIVARMAILGVTIDRIIEEVAARPATARESRILGLAPNAMVLAIERTHFDTDDRPVETAAPAPPAEGWRLRDELPPASQPHP